MKRPLGQDRLDALAWRKSDQHCAICDRRIPGNGPGRAAGRYTCGSRECVASWGALCTSEILNTVRKAKEATKRAAERMEFFKQD